MAQTAPFSQPAFRATRLTVLWLLYVGLSGISGCTKTQQPQPEVTTVTDEEANRDANTISEEVSVTVTDGFNLSLWASEKLLADPIALNMDHSGRAWVTVTNRRSGSDEAPGGGLDWMAESLGFETVEDRRSYLHRVLAPDSSSNNAGWLPDRNGDGSHDWRDLAVEKESIYVIEDRSGDGRADRSSLFIRDFHDEVTNLAGAVLYHDGEVFLGVGPDLWRLRDTDGDGMADEKESISHGYNVHIGRNGHGMSGLRMGPDGKLYWSVGDHGLNVVDKNGKRWRYLNQGSILRSNPDGSDFEVFAAGLRNTHEFSFDKYGNLITVDHDGDYAGEFERLVYLINGSDSGWRTNWQFGKYSDPKNNGYNVWMDEEYFKTRFEGQAAHVLPPLAPYHTGPSGMVYNPGTALSDAWKDHFFVAIFPATPARALITAFTLKPKGASFELDTDQEVLRGILGVGMDFGPDGALYMTDWIQGWGTNGVGRIWKLDTTAEENSALRAETQQLLTDEFHTHSNEELLSLLRHADMRVRKKSQFELVRRNAAETLNEAIAQTTHQLERVHGIWGIGQLARNNADVAAVLTGFLNDSDPEISAQAARILGDIRYEPAAESIIPLLKDENARVRMFAAEALGRMAHQPAVQHIIDMLEENDDEDVYLRIAGAIALARIGDAEALTVLHTHPSRAVRIGAVVSLKRMESPGVAEFLKDDDPFIVTNAARAINDDQFIDEALPELARMLEQSRVINEPLMRRAINAALYSGTPDDARLLANFAARVDVPDVLRSEALATLGVWHNPSLLDRVTGHYRGEINRDPSVARQAVASVIQTLLTEETETLKVAAAEAVGNLAYEAAFGDLYRLLEGDASTEVRAASLRSLGKGGYTQMGKALETALNDKESAVRMVALEMTPELDIADEEIISLLASVLGNYTIPEQQSALETLGRIRSEEAYDVLNAQLDQLMSNELDAAVQLDLIQAIENSGSNELNRRLTEYKEAKNDERPVEAFREVLWGGDAGRGRQIFYRHNAAQCTRCHAIGGRGGDVGPELTGIAGTLTREQLLEALVDPGARIAPGYGFVSVTLEDGQKLQGTVSDETQTILTLDTGGEDDGHIQVQKELIAERINPPSAMPPNGEILTRTELRDLVEFLNTLK